MASGPSLRLLRRGERGEVWIYLPTSGGDAGEWGRYGFDALIEPHVAAGRLQLWTFDACGPTTLFDPRLDPPGRIAAYARFERELRDGVVPFIQQAVEAAPLHWIGASYGAFVLANVWAKRPDCVASATALGGVFEMWHRLDGFHDDDVYYHTPLEFLPRLGDELTLHRMRSAGPFKLFAAQDDPWLDSTYQFISVLRGQGLPYTLDLWAAPHRHHETTWSAQLNKWLAQRFPD